MKKTLIFFVDGLQFDVAIELLNFIEKDSSSRIIPGVGFSNNIYPEMFCGQTPDEIGYFNEWAPGADLKMGKPSLLLKLLDIFRPNLYINAGIRKIICRKIFNANFANIPFRYAGTFAPQGSHNFRDLNHNSILRKFDFAIFDSAEKKLPVGKRDKAILAEALTMVVNKNMFISLVDTDNYAHIYGIDSLQFKKHVAYLEGEIIKLTQKFQEINRSCNVFLLSDHGMAPVYSYVNVDMEEQFGRMCQGRYLYFTDATFIRAWIRDPALFKKIENYLSSQSFGQILSARERAEFGISSREFGDMIFRANEGVMFLPNFFGARRVKAMHGYDSKLSSQNAIFSDIQHERDSVDLPVSSKGCFTFLLRELSSE